MNRIDNTTDNSPSYNQIPEPHTLLEMIMNNESGSLLDDLISALRGENKDEQAGALWIAKISKDSRYFGAMLLGLLISRVETCSYGLVDRYLDLYDDDESSAMALGMDDLINIIREEALNIIK